MKLLYIATHQAWPVNTGARLRDYHLARRMARHASVTFFEMVVPSDDQSSHPPADSGFERVVTCRRNPGYTPGVVLRGFIGPTPLTVLNYWSDTIAARLADVLREESFDSVQLESIHLFPYLSTIRQAAPNTPVVYDYHNVESELMLRFAQSSSNPLKQLVARRTAHLLQRMELLAERSCQALTVPSDIERQAILKRSPETSVYTIPNGVDTQHFDECYYNANPAATDLVFVGSMDYHANVDATQWFVRTIWPTLASQDPNMKFVIVGRNPGPQVRALASERVVVTGTVDDVRPFYANAFAVVAPLRVGSGTRLKILEAMAAGAPVVSTRLGAEGIDVTDGETILLAETPAETTHAIRRLAESPDLRMRLRTAAREFVFRNYDWSIIGDNLVNIHQSLSKAALKP